MVSLKFKKEDLQKLDEIADREYMPRATMLKKWILERLREELKDG